MQTTLLPGLIAGFAEEGLKQENLEFQVHVRYVDINSFATPCYVPC